MQNMLRSCVQLLQKIAGMKALGGLAVFLEKETPQQDRAEFFKTTLPLIKRLVLSLPDCFPAGTCLPLLPRQTQGSVHHSKAQCAALVASAWMCLLPSHGGASLHSEDDEWPD